MALVPAAAALAWTGGGTAGAAQQAAPAAGAAVTLVTGDRVTLDGASRRVRDVVAGPGRDGTRFVRQRVGADDYVIPADVVPMLAAGTVDRQLFNVSRLAEQGKRTSKGAVKLIVRYSSDAAVRSAGTPAMQERTVSAPARMTAVSAEAAEAPALWTRLRQDVSAGRVQKVWLDRVHRLTLDRSTGQIGAPAAWKSGLDGKDVKVAVLDSGYDGTHPDLKDTVVEAKSFVDGEKPDHDPSGHGTHVASTVAGSGAAGGGKYRGVAPGAKLMVGKVCTDDVTAEESCPSSAILAGMTWAAEQGARVVNLSLGEYGTPEKTPDEELVDTLTAKYGTLFVAAVGNGGNAPGSPASADAALAVGSVDPADRLSEFSTRGPRVRDQAIKPDLVAPGERITAARSSAMEGGQGNYAEMGGTSMASPHVAGAAALVAQAHPDWKAAQIKSALMATAAPISTPFRSGSGRVDVARAVTQVLLSEPASVSFGQVPWPQSPGDTRTQTVTLRNTSAGPLSLTLKVADATTPGVFSVPGTVVVPAGGTTPVTVTAASPASAPTGKHTAVLLAQTADGGVRARVPIGLVREPENYQHTITLLDRAGKPTTGDVMLIPVGSPDEEALPVPVAVAGKPATVRLPRGRWHAVATFQSAADDPKAPMVLGALLDVDSKDHQKIEFDGRKGKPFTITAPDSTVRLVDMSVGIHSPGILASIAGSAGEGATGNGGWIIPAPGYRKAKDVEFKAVAVFAKPVGTGFDGTPEVYQAAVVQEGALPAKLDIRPRRTDFATVTSHYRPGTDSTTREAFPLITPMSTDNGYTSLAIPATGTRTTHLAGIGPVRWAGLLRNDGGTSTQYDEARTYRPGQKADRRWNQPLQTLALPRWAWDNNFILRRGRGFITLKELPMYSGSADGHHGYLAGKEKVELFENGTSLGTENSSHFAPFEVGFDPADYRLVVHATPTAPDVPGGSSTLEWTFRSSPPAEDQRVPVSVAHYAPTLDAEGRAPAGTAFPMPIQIQGAPGDVTKLTVDASYDGGKTWTPAPVTGKGTGWTATLHHPATPGGTVSLRSHLVRADGGTTKHTQLHAYRLRGGDARRRI